jgi:hypothetical protein
MKIAVIALVSMLLAPTLFASEKPARLTTSVVRTGALVESINAETRELRLVGTDGRLFTLHVDDRVENFDQIQPRDRIVVEYEESVAVVVSPGHRGELQDADIAMLETAAKGDRPGLLAKEATIIQATVISLDVEGRWATLQLADGSTRRIQPSPEVDLNMIDIGDRVTAVVTHAVAISVSPPKE